MINKIRYDKKYNCILTNKYGRDTIITHDANKLIDIVDKENDCLVEEFAGIQIEKVNCIDSEEGCGEDGCYDCVTVMSRDFKDQDELEQAIIKGLNSDSLCGDSWRIFPEEDTSGFLKACHEMGILKDGINHLTGSSDEKLIELLIK